MRLGAVPFAVFQVATSERYPAHYEAAAWITTAIFGIGVIVFFALTRSAAAPTCAPARGAGLGLFIALSIAEAHGGALEVESEPQRGSCFTLELPTGGGSGSRA